MGTLKGMIQLGKSEEGYIEKASNLQLDSSTTVVLYISILVGNAGIWIKYCSLPLEYD